jgi:hypothetical protein
MKFTVESYFNPFLPLGGKRIDAVLTVSCENEGVQAVSTQDRAIELLLDTSGSMDNGNRMHNMKLAARTAVERMPDGVLFGIIAFNSDAHVLVPLQRSTPQSRAQASNMIQQLHAGGGTEFSKALLAARNEFLKFPGVIACARLLTDGENNKDDTKKWLKSAVAQCQGVFQCDTRGVDTDWQPDDLKYIASSLLGNAEAVTDASKLAEDFQDFLNRSVAKSVAGATLRLWSPKTSKLVLVKQVSPDIIDLMPQIKRIDDKNVEVQLGSWATEKRDYQIAFELEPNNEGEEVLACRPKLIYVTGGQTIEVPGQNVVATWSSDESKTTRMNKEVAHYNGQGELQEAIEQGMKAKAAGNVDVATRLLGKAARLAVQSGNDEVTRRLEKVVSIDDAASETVRLKRTDKAADLELEVGATRTVRRSRPATA